MWRAGSVSAKRATRRRQGRSFGVADANGDSIAFVYYAEANRAAYFNNPEMMKDDARRIAHVIARIPELLEIEKRAKGEMPET